MHRPQACSVGVGLALALLLLAAGCTSGGPARPAPGSSASPSPSSVLASATPTSSPPPASVTVAFVEALGEEEAGDRIAPAFQGVRLAFSIAEVVGGLSPPVEVVAFDTDGDPSRTAEVAAEIASTPEIVAAIAAPGLGHQEVLGDGLDQAGVPWISLSPTGSMLAERGWSGWRRLVADDETQGDVLGGVVAALRAAGRGVCLFGDGTREAREILDAAVRRLRAAPAVRALVTDDPTAIATAVDTVAETGCGVVLWGGGGAQGAAIRRQLIEDGLGRVALVGTERIRDAGYLEAAGPAGEGTLATCPCVDLSTSTELAAQRFIQDYQSDFGLPPGPYAVEGWDAGRILVAAFRAGAITRDDVRVAFDVLFEFDGLAGTYRFDDGGDLASPRRSVRLSKVEGGRWLQLDPASPSA